MISQGKGALLSPLSGHSMGSELCDPACMRYNACFMGN